MNIIDRAQDALDKATPGPWNVNHRQDRSFRGHAVVEPERGAYTICEMTDQNVESTELVALAPELAAAVDRAAKLADKLKAQGQRLSNSAYVHERAEGSGYAAAAAQLVAALEGAEE